jgi:hypothetical protein
MGHVVLNSGIESIGENCFFHCNRLWAVVFEENCCISVLGQAAFHACSSLASICIPASVEKVGKECFGKCYQLTQVAFGEGCRLREVGEAAFDSKVRLFSIPADAEFFDEIYAVLSGRYGREKIQVREANDAIDLGG